MIHHRFLLVGVLLSCPMHLLVAMETCPAMGMPGIPGFPGMPGKDGRSGEKGEKGEPGVLSNHVLGPQKGEKGEPGRTGYQGKRGQIGDQGNEGPQGQMGQRENLDIMGNKAAFSVARGTNEYPDKVSVIRFTNIITNINNDYDETTGHFRCRVPGTYYFVFHASVEDRLCLVMKVDDKPLTSFCDHRRNRRQVTSGGLAVYLFRDQEVWLETKDYRGMRGSPAGYSVFSGFLLSS